VITQISRKKADVGAELKTAVRTKTGLIFLVLYHVIQEAKKWL